MRLAIVSAASSPRVPIATGVARRVVRGPARRRNSPCSTTPTHRPRQRRVGTAASPRPGRALRGGGRRHRAYRQGYLPGAVGWNWETQPSEAVRRDIVGREELSELLSTSGVGADTHVLLHGDNDHWFSTWACWGLRLHGVERVRSRTSWAPPSRPDDGETGSRYASAGSRWKVNIRSASMRAYAAVIDEGRRPAEASTVVVDEHVEEAAAIVAARIDLERAAMDGHAQLLTRHVCRADRRPRRVCGSASSSSAGAEVPLGAIEEAVDRSGDGAAVGGDRGQHEQAHALQPTAELLGRQASFGRDDLAQVRTGSLVAAVERGLQAGQVLRGLLHRTLAF